MRLNERCGRRLPSGAVISVVNVAPLILGGKNPPNIHKSPVSTGFDDDATWKIELKPLGDSLRVFRETRKAEDLPDSLLSPEEPQVLAVHQEGEVEPSAPFRIHRSHTLDTGVESSVRRFNFRRFDRRKLSLPEEALDDLRLEGKCPHGRSLDVRCRKL